MKSLSEKRFINPKAWMRALDDVRHFAIDLRMTATLHFPPAEAHTISIVARCFDGLPIEYTNDQAIQALRDSDKGRSESKEALMMETAWREYYNSPYDLALDLRRIAETFDATVGYKTASANTIFEAAATIDGLPKDYGLDDAIEIMMIKGYPIHQGAPEPADIVARPRI